MVRSNCQIPCANFDTRSRFLSKFCIPFQCHEPPLLYTFLAETISSLLRRSPLKRIFFRFMSAQVKNCQISYVNFEMTSWFLSKRCIPFQFHGRLLLCNFLAQTIYSSLISSPWKWKSLRLSNGQVKLSNSWCQFWNEESIPFKILYPS